MFLKFFFKDISAREQGSNKKTASASCALSLLRQLYHLQVIEGFTGQTKKSKAAEVTINIIRLIIVKIFEL